MRLGPRPPEQSRTSGLDGAKRTGEEAKETQRDRASNEAVRRGEAGLARAGRVSATWRLLGGKELKDSGWLWARDLYALSVSQLCERLQPLVSRLGDKGRRLPSLCSVLGC